MFKHVLLMKAEQTKKKKKKRKRIVRRRRRKRKHKSRTDLGIVICMCMSVANQVEIKFFMFVGLKLVINDKRNEWTYIRKTCVEKNLLLFPFWIIFIYLFFISLFKLLLLLSSVEEK